jgi:hypothetical protein
MAQNDITYQSQLTWLQDRMARKGRTNPPDLAGQKVDVLDALRRHLRLATEYHSGAQLCFLVFFTESRLFSEFCKPQKPLD